MMEIITSRKNPLLQKIRQLSSGGRSVREKAGEYLGDGVKLLEDKHSLSNSGSFKVAYRMFPKNVDLPHRQDFCYVRWFN